MLKSSFKRMLKDNSSAVRSERGFSLLEILIALTLLGLVATFVTSKIFQIQTEGQREACKIQMAGLAENLKLFRRKCGFYPTSDQGLESLSTKPSGKECKNYPTDGFLGDDAEVPQDPWGEDYTYESNGKKFKIISYGPDREEGGEEMDADIIYPIKKRRK